MTLNKAFSFRSFKSMPVIGIMRELPLDVIQRIVPLYYKSGLTTIEITMNSTNAAQSIKTLRNLYPVLNIGAGTVCGMEDLLLALKAGASFIVTPILNKEVIVYCVKRNIPIFPGALTPSEIYDAWRLGATAIKVFPSTYFGIDYIKELKGPLNNIPLLPTGGVNFENIEGFLKTGVFGVGIGNCLFDKKKIELNDYDGLYKNFEKLVSIVLRLYS